MWDELEPVLVAMAIGAMVGAERERSHRDVPDHFGGIRTFTVLALVGALARLVSIGTVAVGVGAAGVSIAAASWCCSCRRVGCITCSRTASPITRWPTP
ncbi:MAG: MgtC/SapB family protein [Actinobacteria bacterium]|nr:MgtC/SapB family protein [Actinomycetota bacterium]